MLSILDIAKDIQSGSLRKCYFFTGPDYGVKLQYLNTFATMCDNNVQELDSFESVQNLLSRRTLIPRPKTEYIVRYSQLSDIKSCNLSSLKFFGTIVCIEDSDDLESKISKLYPENTVRFNHLTPTTCFKHLSSNYSKLPTRLVECISRWDVDYLDACNMCEALSALDTNMLSTMNELDIKKLFDYNNSYASQRLKSAVLARDFKYAIRQVDLFDEDVSFLFYDILSSYLDIIKVLEKPSYSSYAKQYSNRWTLSSAKYMYRITFDQLNKIRMYPNYDPKDALIYVLALLQFRVG